MGKKHEEEKNKTYVLLRDLAKPLRDLAKLFFYFWNLLGFLLDPNRPTKHYRQMAIISEGRTSEPGGTNIR